MKKVLHDRFLLALIGILLIAVLVFGYFFLEDNSEDFNYGQNLTEQQKIKAISIALNNSFVKNELEGIAYHADGTYHVKDIRPPGFYETGPNVSGSRALPAVEFVIGDENDRGTNALVYVDLREGRVVHIRFVKRTDNKGRVPLETHIDKTIVNTGYTYNQSLTEEQKADAVRIALDDKRVQDLLNRMNYSLNSVGMTQFGKSGPGYDYVEIYPSVSFMVGKVYEPGYMVMVLVDINNEKVVNVITHPRTPVPVNI